MTGVITMVSIPVMVSIAAYLIGSMFNSIRKEKRSSGVRTTWSNFGLSVAFCVLFLTSRAAQALSERSNAGWTSSAVRAGVIAQLYPMGPPGTGLGTISNPQQTCTFSYPAPSFFTQ